MSTNGPSRTLRCVRALVALGGNAMTRDGLARPQDQIAAIGAAMEPVADLVARGHEVVAAVHANVLDTLPEELREPFVDAVCERAGSPLVLDYVRLNIDARKPE